MRYGTEACDDGNTNNYDGCSSTCGVEQYFVCVGGSATSADTCYCDLSVASATFAGNWRRIDVTFNYPIEIIVTATADPCAAILGPTLHSLLGVGAVCSTSNKVLTLSLGTGSSFTSTTLLSIRASSLRITSISCNNMLFNNLAISPDSSVLTPVAVIKAPTYLSLCTNLVLTNEGSAANCGSLSSLSVVWTLEDVAPNWSGKSAYIPVIQSSLSGAGGSVTIQASNLMADKQYTFRLTVTNAAGGTASTTASVTTSGEVVPMLSVIGPGTQYYYVHQHIVVRVNAELSSCTGSTSSYVTNDLKFNWTLAASSDPSIQTLTALSQTPQNLSFVELFPFSATAGNTYKIAVTAYIPADPKVATTGYVEIHVLHGALIPFIRGQNRTVFPNQSFDIDGSASYDASFLHTDPKCYQLSYEWECIVPLKNTRCNFKNGTLVEDILAQSGSMHAFSASEFEAPILMEFKLTVRSGTRSAFTVAAINIVDTLGSSQTEEMMVMAPYVLFPLENTARVNSNSTIVLRGVYPGNATDVTFAWKCILGPCEGVAFLSPADRLAATVSIIATDSSSSVIAFQLSAGKKNGTTANSTLLLTLNKPPRIGSFTVLPAVGYALSTKFVVSASGWSDPEGDSPLQYEFSASGSPDFADSVPLSDQMLQSYVQTMLWKPQQNSSSNTLYLRVRVFDSQTAFSESITTVQVLYGGDPLKYLSYLTSLNSVYEGLTTNNIEFFIRVP